MSDFYVSTDPVLRDMIELVWSYCKSPFMDRYKDPNHYGNLFLYQNEVVDGKLKTVRLSVSVATYAKFLAENPKFHDELVASFEEYQTLVEQFID